MRSLLLSRTNHQHCLTLLMCCCAVSACVVRACISQLPHASTLEELHRHPLWRYGSTAAQWPEPRSTSSHHSSRPLAPAEAESALLAYVRMAAEAEQQAGGSSPRQQARRLAQLSPTDIAAELHALYTLAAIHVASQQESSEQQQGGRKHKQHHGSKPSLTDGDFMQLLKAYSALEDRSHQQQQQHQPGDSGTEWDSQAQAAAAAVGALYAFAKLADQQQEQEQSQQEQDASQQDGQLPGQQAQRAHQPTAAPGQLRAGSGSGSSTVHQAFKSLAASSSMDGLRGSNGSSSSNSSSAASGDLQVLLKLAQLGLQAASG
jgi:hypothetical protein